MNINVQIKSIVNELWVGDEITVKKTGKVLPTVRAAFTYELLTADGQSTGELFDGEVFAAFRKDTAGVKHPYQVGQKTTATIVLSTTVPGLWWPRFEGMGRRAIVADVLTKAGYRLPES